MKFKIKVKSQNAPAWWEEYEKDTSDPQKWAEQTIRNFNNTLRPYEESRTLLEVVIEDDANDAFTPG